MRNSLFIALNNNIILISIGENLLHPNYVKDIVSHNDVKAI